MGKSEWRVTVTGRHGHKREHMYIWHMVNKAGPEEHSSEHLWYAFPGIEAKWENTQMINFCCYQSGQMYTAMKMNNLF